MSILDSRVTALIAAGFGLVILLMLATGFHGLTVLGELERGSTDLLTEEHTSVKALSVAQELETELDETYFSVPAERTPLNPATLAARVDQLEQRIRQVVEAGVTAADVDAAPWEAFRAAALDFITMARAISGGEQVAAEAFDAAYARVRESVARLIHEEDRHNEALLRRDRAAFAEQFGVSIRLLALTGGLALVVAGATIFLVRRLLGRLEWQRAELTRLSADILNTQEDTLRQVSHDLHDQFGQALTAIEANLSALETQSSDKAVKDRIEDCIGLVQDLISEARTLSHLLRPSLLDDFGLVAALEWLGERYTERTGIAVAFASNVGTRLPSATETHCFRIAQEALTNVVRHSHATRVEIGLHREGEGLRLTIVDNGHGLSRLPRGGHPGMGLRNMRARASQLGGTIDVGVRPSGGTCVSVFVPGKEPENVALDTVAAG
jgi:signal transduction histidine kinase